MARIRTIKPEFFTSEQVVECSPTARLLFVGMWCFCDDGGVHQASAVTLKMEVFPADAISVEDVRKMIAELESNNLISTYTVDGKDFWRVLGWHHQKIDKPTYKHPKSREFGDESSRRRRYIDESSPPERNGTERNGDESNGIPVRSGKSGPSRDENQSELEDNRAVVIASMTVLSESAEIAVDPLPANKLSGGAFAPLKEKHLSDTRSMLDWFQRQLSLPDPVCGHTRADLLLVLAAGIHATKIPQSRVKKNRVALFVNVVNRGRWRQVTKYVFEANESLKQLELQPGGTDETEK